jgi:hypothetical protein
MQTDRYLAKLREHQENNLTAAAIFIWRYIRQSISIGQPPSRPGEPPHVLTGHLRRNIAWDQPGKLSRRIGLGIGNAEAVNYGIFLEFGTRPHAVTIPRGREMFVQRKTRKGVQRIVRGFSTNAPISYTHPGMAERPYLRPAIPATAQAVERILRTPMK